MRFKGALVDIDNTLYDYGKAHGKALARAVARASETCGVPAARVEEAYAEARMRVNRELRDTAASHNRLLYFQGALEALGVNPMLHALDIYEAYWSTFLDSMELYDDATCFLEHIAGIKVCLVTDLTAHIQHRKVRRLGLHRYAGYIVTSEEAGREKPHRRIFELALEKTGLTAEEVFMVGDSFGKDIQGAAGLGIRSFWVNRDGASESTGGLVTEVASLREVIAHI